jgi:hypothetical protein
MSEDNDVKEIEQKDQEDNNKEAEIVAAESEGNSESVISPEKGIEELRKQIERERSARADAEKRAQEAAQQAYKARNEVSETNLQLVNNAIDTVKRNSDIAKMQYREAMAAGDYDRAADLQQEMSLNAAKLLQLENGKQAMEAQPKPEEPRFTPSDPVEALAAQLSPRSANWVRAHPEYAQDQRLTRKMVAAHQLVVSDGFIPDTDEYFSAIEDALRINRNSPPPARDEAMTDAAKVTQRRSSPAAAPVTRSGTGMGSRNEIGRLSPAEREMAALWKMSEEDYAKHKRALQKEGKIQ